MDKNRGHLMQNDMVVRRSRTAVRRTTSAVSTRPPVAQKPKAPRPKPAPKTQPQKTLKPNSRLEQHIKNNTESLPKPADKKNPKQLRRFIIAFACAALCIFGLICLVKLNIPTISIHIASMQAGIEATYPSYLPRDFSLSNVTSEGNRVVMTFKAGDKEFQLTEEKSSWDSNALLNNFVKPEWQDNYSVAREQGITIYVSDANATWVNGGLLYHINAENDTLSKKQIYNVVTSL